MIVLIVGHFSHLSASNDMGAVERTHDNENIFLFQLYALSNVRKEKASATLCSLSLIGKQNRPTDGCEDV